MGPNNTNSLSNQPKWIQSWASKMKGFENALSNIWKGFTGQSAVDQQNAGQLELAKYQAQVNEDFYNKYSSPEALMRQYSAAGLNPNLVYGSASAGQSNVPSFSAPTLQRNISGSDKLNKALSVVAAIQGIQTSQYQVQAAREAAEQSGIKTLNDLLNYRRNSRDYTVENGTMGYQEQTLFRRMFKKRRGSITKADVEGLFADTDPDGAFNKYMEAARQSYFEQMARAGVQNAKDRADTDYIRSRKASQEIENQYLDEYLQDRNALQKLDREVQENWKSFSTGEGAVMKIVGPLLQLLGRLAGKN